MPKETYVQFNSKPGRKGKAYFEAVNQGLNKFIENEAWNKNIPEDEKRNHGVHVEASYLCHGIWTKIMNNESNEGNLYSSNYFYWNNKILFHFDIMNNPKKQSCGLANCCSDQELDEWTKIYHTIGNMTPIPWFKIDKPTPKDKKQIHRYINGQRLHLALNERWDLFLNLLKNNLNHLYSYSLRKYFYRQRLSNNGSQLSLLYNPALIFCFLNFRINSVVFSKNQLN